MVVGSGYKNIGSLILKMDKISVKKVKSQGQSAFPAGQAVNNGLSLWPCNLYSKEAYHAVHRGCLPRLYYNTLDIYHQ